MSKIALLILLFLFTSNWGFTQPNSDEIKALEKKANHLFEEKRFYKALTYFEKLDNLTRWENPEYQVKLGICYLNSNKVKTIAIDLIQKNEKWFKENKKMDEYYYYMARAFHYNYQFDEAIVMYGIYIDKYSKGNAKWAEDARQNITACQNGKLIMKDPADIKIENIGPVVNSKFPDYVPIITTDESVLIFTSRRESSTGGLQSPTGESDDESGEYFEDIYVTLNTNGKWLPPLKLGGNINTTGHDAAIGLAPDGSELYVYRNDDLIWGNIFGFKQRGMTWDVGYKLPSPINSKYWEGSISVTADGNTIFFASNRPKGGELAAKDKDLYMVTKLPGGEWGEAKNLGPVINTDRDEDAPFIHPDGKTLYFSSRGHNTMGGFDIFVSKYVNGQWTVPINMGFPINSPDDDLYFVLSDDGKKGYYSSTRKDSYGDKDIYVIYFTPKNEELSPEAITVYKGSVKGCGELLYDAEIIVKESETGKFLGSYKPNGSTGNYILILEKGKSFNISVMAEGYTDYITEVETPVGNEYKEIILDYNLCNAECPDNCFTGHSKLPVKNQKVGIVKIEKPDLIPNIKRPEGQDINIDEVLQSVEVEIRNVYYKSESSELAEGSYKEIDKIIELMKEYEEIVLVIIKAHTDSRGRASYNQWLSQQRADAVVKYMVSKGIDRDRLIAKGYGESKLLNNCDDQSDCTEAEHEVNRRTTFQIIGKSFNLISK